MAGADATGDGGSLRAVAPTAARREGAGAGGMLVRRDRALLAVLIMLDIGFHAGRSNTVSAAEIAERSHLARRGIEPLLQALSRSGLLESVRGPRGGYRLGRPRRDITLSEVVSVATADESAEPAPASGAQASSAQPSGTAPAAAARACQPDGPHGALHDAVVERLWGELDASLCERLACLTLDDLLRRAEAAGLRRPLAEPISFSI